ncbi:acetyl-CoA hydrolase/transferase family protein [Desulfitobacterium metallireducens]|uniref:Probable butyrate:acetyl-CoA coenzyme A-transferase n=1 Tax=Desulfitobacterium metallireducens DSM 15288 TaxID=871968 RepID=W0EDD8_9FIRM|nr:acetyl-CoA hydrolase/transferase C-terminal domain-containing protein [Desulfitobacterium metallireducens]AHF07553.1 4-hydroxybutyrate CoA-transferase [Desulfitobacterium metallireducens DSM 15288]
MSYSGEYQKKLVTPEEAVRVVKSGDWVDYGAFAGQVVALDKALAARKEELFDVKIRAVTALRAPEVVKADPEAKHFIYNNWHFSGIDRKLHDKGLCYHIPLLYHELPGYYRRFADVDVAMLPVTPIDEHGFFNFGPQVSHAKATCEKSKVIILEVNPNIPRCLGGKEESIHISQVDYIVESNWTLPQIPSGAPTEIESKIASYIMPELEDGSCIQLGIGGMPNAVGQMIAQSDLNNLGLHSEMFTESMVDMVESGRVTGANKTTDRYKIAYTFAFGTQKTYNFLNNNPMCAIYPVDYVNDPFIIAQNEKVISINNCIEVDLTGQVCSESSGTRQISGTGGQFDFAFGSYRSKGGKSFIAMESTFKKGDELRSRIKPSLTPGAIVTTHRAIVHYLVTEYGIVNLKGKSTWERAEALISIAHPNVREDLIKEAENLGIWRRSNK